MLHLKLANNRVIFPNFQNPACSEKYFKDNNANSLHLGRVLVGYYLILKAHSFPRATVSKNCSLL